MKKVVIAILFLVLCGASIGGCTVSENPNHILEEAIEKTKALDQVTIATSIAIKRIGDSEAQTRTVISALDQNANTLKEVHPDKENETIYGKTEGELILYRQNSYGEWEPSKESAYLFSPERYRTLLDRLNDNEKVVKQKKNYEITMNRNQIIGILEPFSFFETLSFSDANFVEVTIEEQRIQKITFSIASYLLKGQPGDIEDYTITITIDPTDQDLAQLSLLGRCPNDLL